MTVGRESKRDRAQSSESQFARRHSKSLSTLGGTLAEEAPLAWATVTAKGTVEYPGSAAKVLAELEALAARPSLQKARWNTREALRKCSPSSKLWLRDRHCKRHGGIPGKRCESARRARSSG